MPNIKDHKGNCFSSKTELISYWDMNHITFYFRLKKGWDMKTILETPSQKHSVTDHLGKEYDSLTDMAAHYNIGYETLRYRLAHGWTLNDALTTPVSTLRSSEKTQIIDHNGNKFSSKSAMCTYYGVSRALFDYRRRKGFSVKDALLTKPMHH